MGSSNCGVCNRTTARSFDVTSFSWMSRVVVKRRCRNRGRPSHCAAVALDCATPRLSVISWIYERVLRPTWCTRDVRVCPRAFTTGTRVIAFLPTPRGNYNFRGLRLASAVIFFILSFLQSRCGFRRLNSRWADFTRTTTTARAN